MADLPKDNVANPKGEPEKSKHIYSISSDGNVQTRDQKPINKTPLASSSITLGGSTVGEKVVGAIENASMKAGQIQKSIMKSLPFGGSNSGDAEGSAADKRQWCDPYAEEVQLQYGSGNAAGDAEANTNSDTPVLTLLRPDWPQDQAIRQKLRSQIGSSPENPQIEDEVYIDSAKDLAAHVKDGQTKLWEKMAVKEKFGEVRGLVGSGSSSLTSSSAGAENGDGAQASSGSSSRLSPVVAAGGSKGNLGANLKLKCGQNKGWLVGRGGGSYEYPGRMKCFGEDENGCYGSSPHRKSEKSGILSKLGNWLGGSGEKKKKVKEGEKEDGDNEKPPPPSEYNSASSSSSSTSKKDSAKEIREKNNSLKRSSSEQNEMWQQMIFEFVEVYGEDLMSDQVIRDRDGVEDDDEESDAAKAKLRKAKLAKKKYDDESMDGTRIVNGIEIKKKAEPVITASTRRDLRTKGAKSYEESMKGKRASGANANPPDSSTSSIPDSSLERDFVISAADLFGREIAYVKPPIDGDMRVTDLERSQTRGSDQSGRSEYASAVASPPASGPISSQFESVADPDTERPSAPSQSSDAPSSFLRCILSSDTHNHHRQIQFLPEGDVFIHSGDFTSRGESQQIWDFTEWVGSLPYPVKIVIGGNHDMSLDEEYYFEETAASKLFGKTLWPEGHDCRTIKANFERHGIIYLEDETCVLKTRMGKEVVVHGSPVQPWFFNWAWNKHRGPDIRRYWDRIPHNCDILITHGPPLGRGDMTASGTRAGCYDLLRGLRGWTLVDTHKLKLEDGTGKESGDGNGDRADDKAGGKMEVEALSGAESMEVESLENSPKEPLLDYTTRELRLPIKQRIQNFQPPKLHVFGHIHEGYGISSDGDTLFANASTCNLRYRPDQVPLVVDVVL